MRKYNRVHIAIDPMGFDQVIKSAIAELFADDARLDIICMFAHTLSAAEGMGHPLDNSLPAAVAQ